MVQKPTENETDRIVSRLLHQLGIKNNRIQVGGASAINVSYNMKTGPCAVTSVAIASCAEDCPFLSVDPATGDRSAPGCYAFGRSRSSLWLNRLDKHRTAEQLAVDEADCIDQLTSGLDLRIHEAGDCSSDMAADVVALAARRYRDRFPSARVWGYTHAWRRVDVKYWNGVHIFASVECEDDVVEAHDRGYFRTAWTVPQFESARVYIPEETVRVLPCPEMTHGIQCIKCGYCLKGDRRSVAFAVHGLGKKYALRVLPGG